MHRPLSAFSDLRPVLARVGLAACLLVAPALGAAEARAATGIGEARGFAPRQVVVKFEGERFGRAVGLPAGVGVREATAALRRSPGVAYATPNYIATASVIDLAGRRPAAGSASTSAARRGRTSANTGGARASAGAAVVPNDPGLLVPGGPPGGWVNRQWNFLPWEGPGTPLLPTSPGGIDVVGAWRNLEEAGRPGGSGATVAVLDTGVAYRAKGKRYRRSPDFTPEQFVRGYDFIGKDRFPLDENGHGTHVAGTIGEKTNNGVGLTGIAYGAKLMPLRVLDRLGRGRATAIAKGIRFAVNNGADVINMSFNFECGVEIPLINEALRMAYRRGVVTVGAVGNRRSEECVSPPSTGPRVIGVGGSTQGGCLGSYSLAGKYVDLVAPGGARPRRGCPSVLFEPIYQVTYNIPTELDEFGEPSYYAGTSMAAAHVSGVAALVIASGVLGDEPTPDDVFRRLRKTTRDLGLRRALQGFGLIDAARATQPAPPKPAEAPKPATPAA